MYKILAWVLFAAIVGLPLLAAWSLARLYEVLDLFNELEELELSNKLDEQHRELLADVEEKESQCCGALYYAENAILGTKLCTHAGVATQLIFAADRYSANEVDEYRIPLLVNAARTIDGELVSKIEFFRNHLGAANREAVAD
jgi:hypothetical protein